MNSLEGLRKRSLDLQDSEAFEEWVGALKREGLLDKETEGALRLYFFSISFLNLKKKDIDAFSKALVQKMTFGLLETCGVLEGFFKALSFLGKGEELGIEEELEEILNKQ